MTVRRFVFAFLVAVGAWISSAGGLIAAEERVALVIGNSAYGAGAALKNPKNDADLMSAALQKLRFKVTKKLDVDQRQFDATVREFKASLTKESVAAFFFAGHGLQVKGENYLVPIKAAVKEEDDVKYECVNLSRILDSMDAAGAPFKLIVVDCCRDNPFERGWKRNLGEARLAAVNEVPRGTVIAFSTSPGTTALDGKGDNSPYTKHLARILGTRPANGLEVTGAIRGASKAVFDDVGQQPWIHLDATMGDYFLQPPFDPKDPQQAPPPPAPAAKKPAVRVVEGHAWKGVLEAIDPDGSDVLSCKVTVKSRGKMTLWCQQNSGVTWEMDCVFVDDEETQFEFTKVRVLLFNKKAKQPPDPNSWGRVTGKGKIDGEKISAEFEFPDRNQRGRFRAERE